MGTNNENSIPQRMLKHLKSGGVITTLDGVKMFNTVDIRKEISVLRKRGHNIKDEWVVSPSGKRYKKYFMEEEQYGTSDQTSH